MLNWWLILLIIIIPLICIALTVYVILYFQSEEDAKTDLIPKTVFGIGLILALGSVLLVPYDAANSPDPTKPNKYNKTLNTQLMWEIVLWIMAVMAVIICPFFLFYYEAYDPDKPRVHKQIIHAVIYTFIIFAVYIIITSICYAKVGIATIKYNSFATDAQFVSFVNANDLNFNATSSSESLNLHVSFTTYCIGMLCFFGWIFFLFYGGIGLVAYPINLIRNFIYRTKAIGASRFNEEMAVVLAKADALLEVAIRTQKESRGRMSQALRSSINILRNEVYFLELEQAQLIWAYTKAGGSPFIVYGKLLLGIICLATALMWCLHIFIYNTFNADPFLNTMLIGLSNAFALFGIIAYGVLAFYLMWATFQGQIALGLRLIFFQIHPMQKHDTLVNAFLFNVSLLLITAFAVIQFVARSFQDYAPLTAINGLMNLYVLHLRGIGEIIRWIQYAFIGMAMLALIWVPICPHKKKRDPTKIRLDY